MSDDSFAPADPVRQGLAKGLLGGAAALAAITVAHASLPDPTPIRSLRRPAPPRVAPQPAPTTPAPLIVFQPPLPDGSVGSPFGLRQLPWEEKARLHAGVDLEAPGPEAVLAAADGVVTRLGEDAGYGRFVELTHADGITTLYGHMQRLDPALSSGAAVKAGTPVGRIGSTGTSTGVHLHFEVRDSGGRPLNPELLLGKAFATAQDLPLREARRIPRHVRLAFVSRIPASKKAQMQARLDGDAAAAAASEAASAEPTADPTADAVATPLGVARKSHGRVHMRLRS